MTVPVFALKHAGSAGILPASARSAEVFSPFAYAAGDAGSAMVW
jgi:hypothetical protein